VTGRLWAGCSDKGPPSRRRLLAALGTASRELMVKTVAEGVETPAEDDRFPPSN